MAAAGVTPSTPSSPRITNDAKRREHLRLLLDSAIDADRVRIFQSAIRDAVLPLPTQPTILTSTRTLLIVGLDVSYSTIHADRAVGCAALYALQPGSGTASMTPVAYTLVRRRPGTAYAPGFLAGREASIHLEALKKLCSGQHIQPPSSDPGGAPRGATRSASSSLGASISPGQPIVPDVLLVDGAGTAHPDRAGLACVLGAMTGVRSVGCAKTWLCGKYDALGSEQGSRSALKVDCLAVPSLQGSAPAVQEVVGHAFRTQHDVRPVFISPGYGISIEDASDMVTRCVGQYRLPEAIRAADRWGRSEMRKWEAESDEGS